MRMSFDPAYNMQFFHSILDLTVRVKKNSTDVDRQSTRKTIREETSILLFKKKLQLSKTL